jgi:hypothetical protein
VHSASRATGPVARPLPMLARACHHGEDGAVGVRDEEHEEGDAEDADEVLEYFKALPEGGLGSGERKGVRSSLQQTYMSRERRCRGVCAYVCACEGGGGEWEGE